MNKGDHACFFFQTDEAHRTVIADFLTAGVANGEKAYYFADGVHPDAAAAYLADADACLGDCLAEGTLSVVNADDIYTRRGAFDPDEVIAFLNAETEKTLRAGYAGLRITGEMTWALRRLPEFYALMAYEANVNDLFVGGHFTALCQYDRRRFDPALLREILHAHPRIIHGTETIDNYCYIPAPEFADADPEDTKLTRCLDTLSQLQTAVELLYKSAPRLKQNSRSDPGFLNGELADAQRRINRVLTSGSVSTEWARRELADVSARIRRLADDAGPAH